MSKLKLTRVCLLLTAAAILACPGCGKITGPSFAAIASPRVIITTPSTPASGNIILSFQLIDRELEQGDITVEYSTDGGQTFHTATLTAASQTTGLASDWYPGITHTVQWESVTDMVGRSGEMTACVRVTPSDASNPSGTAGITGTFTVDNIAYNQAPTATVVAPTGGETDIIPITYFLADDEGDPCSVTVEYSIDNGVTYQPATIYQPVLASVGDGTSGLSSSPSPGTGHLFLWNSVADNVAPAGWLTSVRVRITPTDYSIYNNPMHQGSAGATASFSVNNVLSDSAPTVTITGGPDDGSTVYTRQVTFEWVGFDADGTVLGYHYSMDSTTMDTWTTDISAISEILPEGEHTFRVLAMDDNYRFSAVKSRTFTSLPGIIEADFNASPKTGSSPLTVNFIDLSTASSGIDSWSWRFGDGSTSIEQNPSHIYGNDGSFIVTLTVTGPDGSNSKTRDGFIYAGPEPFPPTDFYGVPTSASSITWYWTDNSFAETGFRVHNTSEFSVGTTGPNVTFFTETGLDENTPYTRHAHCSTGAGGGGTASIGTGTNSERFPINIFYDYSRCQMLYLQSEINTAGKITKIMFYQNNSNSAHINNCTIYMYETPVIALSGWTGPASGPGTLVFSGNLTSRSSSGWYEITLTTPFLYANTQNLLISFRHQDGSYESSYPEWNTTSAPGKCVRGYSDADNPPSVSSEIYRPNIRLVLTSDVRISVPSGTDTVSTLVRNPANGDWLLRYSSPYFDIPPTIVSSGSSPMVNFDHNGEPVSNLHAEADSLYWSCDSLSLPGADPQELWVEFFFDISGTGVISSDITALDFTAKVYFTGRSGGMPTNDPMELEYVDQARVQIYNYSSFFWESMGTNFFNSLGRSIIWRDGPESMIWDSTTDTNPGNPIVRSKLSASFTPYVLSDRIRIRLYIRGAVVIGWDIAWVLDYVKIDFTVIGVTNIVRINISLPPNAFAGDTGVKIERADNSTFTSGVTTIQNFTYNYAVVDDTVTSGRTYWYRIAYRNLDGVETANSPPKSITVP